MKCTCPTQRPNARHPTPPIFHWEWGSRWLPNAKKSTQKKRNVHGRCKKLASPNARDTNMLVFLALGDAKLLSFASGDAKVPDARYFAFWWNIGLNNLATKLMCKFLIRSFFQSICEVLFAFILHFAWWPTVSFGLKYFSRPTGHIYQVSDG